jgi:hypothetical protein
MPPIFTSVVGAAYAHYLIEHQQRRSSGDFSPAVGGIKMTATKKATQFEWPFSIINKTSQFSFISLTVLWLAP